MVVIYRFEGPHVLPPFLKLSLNPVDLKPTNKIYSTCILNSYWVMIGSCILSLCTKYATMMCLSSFLRLVALF